MRLIDDRAYRRGSVLHVIAQRQNDGDQGVRYMHFQRLWSRAPRGGIIAQSYRKLRVYPSIARWRAGQDAYHLPVSIIRKPPAPSPLQGNKNSESTHGHAAAPP